MPANKTKSERTETAARDLSKILLFDVETSPNISYTWGKWEQNVIEFIKERQIICFAWKWLGEKQSHSLGLPDFPGYKKNPDDNKALILELHKLISRADIVVGHNVDGFDDKRANTDFIKHNLPPPPPHKTIDTLKVARGKFQFNSNKLGDLGKFLGLGSKVEHWGFELWRRCMAGDPQAWSLMKRYNRGDVDLLEAVYLRERPWMTNHPNLNKPDGHVGCPKCRSVNFLKHGWNVNRWGSAPRFRCKDCYTTFSGQFMKGGATWRMA
jgi:hypothetical protein